MRAAGVVPTILVALSLLAGAPPRAALAAPVCGPRATALAWLAREYREAPVAWGVTDQGGLVEVLTSGEAAPAGTPGSVPGTATWSLLHSAPGGESCLIAAGRGWRPLPGPGSGAPGRTPQRAQP